MVWPFVTYPSGLNVQVALAVVPPEEVLVRVQVFEAALKFSFMMVGDAAHDEDEFRLKGVPGQTEADDEDAFTEGIGFTVTLRVTGLPWHKFV